MSKRLQTLFTLAALACATPALADGPAVSLLADAPQIGQIVLGGDCAGGEIYDDGTAENGYSGNPATVSNFQGTQVFTPASYPFTYNTVCVGLVSLGGPTLDFSIQVYDDDGAGGSPGTLIDSLPVSAGAIPGGLPCAFYSYDISSLNLNIASGNVYLGVSWNPMLFPSRFICADQTVATPLHPGFVNFNLAGGWQATQTVFPAYRAKLIRALGGPAGTDLSITKTGSETVPGTVVYTLTVNNNGPADATGVVVTDTLPAELAYVSDDCGGTNTPPWTWNIGALANGGSAVCNITLSVVTPGLTSNTATVAATEPELDPSDNSSTFDLTTVGVNADLQILKTGLEDPLGTVTYTVTVTNNGPSPATGVVVTDTLPVELAYVSDDCGASNNPPWTWNIGNLAVAGSVTCHITLSVVTPGPVVNTATVAGNETDLAPGNNSSTATNVFSGVPPSVLEIPTLGVVGFAALLVLLAASAVVMMRRRRA